MAISIGVWFGIVLGGLIVLTFIAGMIKVVINKKRLKKNTKIAAAEAAAKSTDKEKLVRGRGEGDLFGVRALESGYFGGVAQSRPASPSPSYILAPGQSLVDWGKGGHSANSSVVEFPRNDSRNTSVSSFAPGNRPSPLRLQPPDHISRRNDSAASIGGVGGSYMPPLPSPRENRSVMPFLDSDKPAGWVSPLDVHFSRPTTPQPTSRPTSYLPKLDFPEQFQKTTLMVPPPGTGIRSEAASIVSTEVSIPAPASNDPPTPSPTLSIFPQSRAARQSTRSIFHSSSSDRPPSRKSPKVAHFPSDVPLNNLPPSVSQIDPNLNFPFDNRQWAAPAGPFNPPVVIRDSIVSKHRISIFQPPLDSPDAPSFRSRAQSVAASSIYSRASIHEPSYFPPMPTHRRAQSHSRSRSRSRSTSLSRSHDSIRVRQNHVRQSSSASSLPKANKRYSKDRDALHFDPSATRRTRSGSIAGRGVDFDHPRDSPFSNAHSIATSDNGHSNAHSASSSLSSISLPPPPPHLQQHLQSQNKNATLPLPTHDPLRLSVTPSISVNQNGSHLRNPSEASQASISDFYDAYYRNSTMARASQLPPPEKFAQLPLEQRRSVLDAARAFESQNQNGGRNLLGNGNGGGNGQGGNNGGRRPPPQPLKLGLNGVGKETIMELPTPRSGDASANANANAGREDERFPKFL